MVGLGIWSLQASLKSAPDELQHRTKSYVRTAHGLSEEITKDLLANPNSPELLTAAGLAVERKEGVTKAFPFYERASQLGPERFFPTFMRARANQLAGNIKEAASDYARACELDRGLPRHRRQWMNAILGLPGGRELIPGLTAEKPACTQALIKHSIQERQTEAVIDISRLSLQGKPGDARFLYWHARSLYEVGRREEASKVTAILLGLHPDSAEGFLLTGIMQRAQSNFEAMHLFNESLNRAPNWEEPALLLAQTAIQERDEKIFLRAMHGLSQSLGNKGKTPQIFALEAQFAYANEDFEDAARKFRRAGPWLHHRAPFMLQFLDALSKVGKRNSALALCERMKWPDTIQKSGLQLCAQIKSDQAIP